MTNVQIAHAWFEGWNTHNYDLLRLTPDFKHTSPLGTIEGRETYLETVIPMARKSNNGIKVKETVDGGDVVVVKYESQTPSGPMEACDWIYIRDGMIHEIVAFYDATEIRKMVGDY